jgi:hypothetical protein
MTDESGAYDLEYGQPTVEGTGPAGGGVTEGADAGGNKRDPVESAPSIGHTIAGRTIDGEAIGAEPGGPGATSEDAGEDQREE